MAVMGELVDRYVALFGPLGGRREIILQEWHRQLGDLPLEGLHRALDTLGRQHEGHGKPRLAQVRALALEATGEQQHEEGAGTEWCSQCRAHYWYAGFESTAGVVPRLRCNCPPSGAGWHTAAAVAWTEDDITLIHAGYVLPADGVAA